MHKERRKLVSLAAGYFDVHMTPHRASCLPI
jgi:hypothetical protein